MDKPFLRLLNYITAYRKLRGRATNRLIIEQLILAYGKQLATGMPEKHWRDNIIVLINDCEEHHAKKLKERNKKENKIINRGRRAGLDI